ncbi:hypothetical protein EYF80_012602 [Liparis tanakae]|uniref:Uncharacterized protein n=1 Tax=Liparis tanakae TaxID=230148 RepID=A0A4Z2IIX1_9TELE|nr:hypothetical protein EYF80_012602 [Liparis tanakae]
MEDGGGKMEDGGWSATAAVATLGTLLTKCEIIFEVFGLKSTELDIKQDKVPWEICHKRTLPQVEVTKQNHRVMVGPRPVENHCPRPVENYYSRPVEKYYSRPVEDH